MPGGEAEVGNGSQSQTGTDVLIEIPVWGTKSVMYPFGLLPSEGRLRVLAYLYV